MKLIIFIDEQTLFHSYCFQLKLINKIDIRLGNTSN